MIVPRTIINRLLSTAQTIDGGSARGVIVRDGDSMRVEAEVGDQEVVAYWVVGVRGHRAAPTGAAPTESAPTLVVDTDVRGVLQVRAVRGDEELPLEITD